MPDTVLNALRNKLARYEADGEPDKVKRVKARIAELEKAPQDEAPKLAMTLTVPAAAPAVLGATVTTTNSPKPTEPTVKKAAAPEKAAEKRKK